MLLTHFIVYILLNLNHLTLRVCLVGGEIGRMEKKKKKRKKKERKVERKYLSGYLV